MDTIAERVLELRTESGSFRVSVLVGRPEPDPDGDWVCPYEIRLGESIHKIAMHGADSMQALQLTLATLDVELRYAANLPKGPIALENRSLAVLFPYLSVAVTTTNWSDVGLQARERTGRPMSMTDCRPLSCRRTSATRGADEYSPAD